MLSVASFALVPVSSEVVAGAVLKHSRDFNMTRECVLNTALAPETPAYDIQQACGTGLQAAFLVAKLLIQKKVFKNQVSYKSYCL